MTLYDRPANPFVAGFIGSPRMNLLEGAVAAENGAELLGVRPEHFALSNDAGSWEGRVRYAEHLGSDTVAYVDVDKIGSVTVRVSGEVPIRAGDLVFLTPNEMRLHKFAGDRRLAA